MVNAHKILAENREGKRLLVRRKNRWEDSIKMVTNEIRYEGVD
jgi:hypothetical protein